MKNNVKQSDWYIGKYGTQSEVVSNGTASIVPTFSMNVSRVVSTQSVGSDYFKSKLEAKGITLSEPVVSPTNTKKVETIGLTENISEVFKARFTESGEVTTTGQLPFQQKFINQGLDSVGSTPFASKSKKFFAKIAGNTPQLDATDFQDFVASVVKLPRIIATRMIKTKSITVNDLVVTDLNYVLKSGDVVRVGVVGHFINSAEGAAIVK